jgi:translocation and assembly module TamB
MHTIVALALVGSAATAALTPAPVATTPAPQQDDPSIIERFIRNRIQKLVEGKVRPGAKLQLGRMTGNWISSITMDSIEIRDSDDSLVFRSGPITARYSARDLVAGRWIFDDVQIERPVLVLREHVNKEWNWQRIFTRTPGPPEPSPAVRAGTLRVRGGSVRIALPWTPEPWYAPHYRDSLVAARVKAGTLASTSEGMVAVYRWTALSADARALDVLAPNRDGGSVNVMEADADEQTPPFNLRDVRGTVRWFRDSVNVAVAGMRAGKTRGSATGAARFDKKGGPARLDFRVRLDSLALADIAWISPTVPTDGGGRATLTVRTDAADPRLIHYGLSDADVRTGTSRIQGAMTFGVGQPLLQITNVALTLDPLGSKEIENFLGYPLPLALTGAFRGTVKASGGPFDKFVLDEANATYVDTRAPKTTVPLKARGTFDLSVPGKAAYKGLAVEAPRLDAAFLVALFPKSKLARGVGAMTATLEAKGDSLWVRDLKASYTRTGVGVTRVAGAVALHRGAKGVDGYDARLTADSLRLTTLLTDSSVARVGALGGTLTARGDLEQVKVTTNLAGPAGAIVSDLAVHYAPGQVINGTVALHDVAVQLADKSALITADAHLRVDLTGDSLPVMNGTVAMDLDSTTIGATRLTAGSMRVRLSDGHAHVDTLVVTTGVARLNAAGGIGLKPGANDTLTFALAVDTLEALRDAIRPLLAKRRPEDSTTMTRLVWDDTVRGRLAVNGAASGRVDSLHLLLRAAVRGLREGATRADSILLVADGLSFRDTITGTASVVAGRAQVGKQAIDHARVEAQVLGTGRYVVSWDADAGKKFDRVTGRTGIVLSGDTTTITPDSIFAHFGPDTVRLTSPTRVVLAPGYLLVDTLSMELGTGGRLFATARISDSAAVTGVLRLEDFPLVVQDSIKQVPPRATALLNARVELAGTRKAPRIEALLDASDVKLAGTAAGAVRVTGEYDKQRLSTTISLDEGTDGALIFAGDLGVDLALTTVKQRFKDEALVGTLRSDSLRLGFLKRLAPQLSEAGGTLRADVNVSGRLERPILEGRVTLDSGVLVSREFGAQLRDVFARIGLRNDSIVFERFSARGERRAGDSLTIAGFAYLPDSGAGALDFRVRANQYGAFRSVSLGSFDLNGEVRLSGTRDAATLEGDVEVYDAIGYIGSKFVKEVEPSRLGLETTAEADSAAAEAARQPKEPSFTQRLRERVAIGDLSLRLGDNVRLRSSDANVILGGEIRATGHLDDVNLSGDLLAKRGIYRLNLGLVSRTFQVDSGRVTFFGPLANSPALDITTTYLVRLENRDQVRIRAQILGTAAVPRIVLSSDDQAASGSSDTELLSLLIFGAPSFALSGQNASALNSVRNALAPTLGGVAERALSSVLPGVDMVRVTMASQGDVSGGDQSNGLLSGASITAGQQLGDRVFISVNTGLGKRSACSDANDTSPWFGLAIEYRLGPSSWLQASMDPGSSSCSGASDVTPVRQFGLDLFREWRFR